MSEFRSGPIAGTTRISGATFSSKPVQYAEVGGLAVFEGDIVLGRADVLRSRTLGGNNVQMSIGITGQQFRWPNATIPYEIDPGLGNQQRITDAMAHWQANTPIRFVLRTAANQAQYPDYVRFIDDGACYSSVGRQGGMQTLSLGPNCGTGNAIHEIGHTVGLWHEQSREDRDAFVEIVWANIDPAMQHNFSQHVSDGDDLGAYDFGSIMHYPATAFSTNGQATIIPRQALPPGVVMGQRNGLSAGDIAGVLAMYPQLPTIKELAKDPITDPTRKEIIKDPIRDPTFKEIRKDPISDPTLKEVRKDPISDPTVKELAKDPIRDPWPTIREVTTLPGGGLPGQLGPFGAPAQTALPYILGAPSRASPGAAVDSALADAQAQVEQIGQLVSALEQQYAEAVAAYDEAVSVYNQLSQGT